MITYSIYIVDDEKALARAIALNLRDEYQVETFFDAEAALEALQTEQPDLILLDIGLPGMDGVEALREIKTLYPEILVLMITAYEEMDTVIAALRSGAYDYIVKPLQMDSLRVSIQNALETIRLRKEVQQLQEQKLIENMPYFIGESSAIKKVMAFVQNVSKSPDTPILIQGESGTGKELIANVIHYSSPNFCGAMVTLNCASIPNELLESELFGYEKGAFTGAEKGGKEGLVEQAESGTLFLDEVGDLSLEAQAKLLRFIETGEFYRVGGTQKVQVKTRIISATNKDLEAMIEEGSFREDLYFRIGVVKVDVPPLKDRLDDIVLIAKYFLVEFGNKFGRKFIGLTNDAENFLQTLEWRGNIRELKNFIERVALTAENPVVSIQDLQGRQGTFKYNGITPGSDSIQIPTSGVDLDTEMAGYEKQFIEEALKITHGNETKAAQLLNIKYTTLRYRRRKYQIQ